MSTLLCVPIMVHDEDAALASARAAHAAGADLVEFRVDEFFTGDLEAPAGGPHPTVLAIERLVAQSPLPCIVTCRSGSEGGGYGGDETDRVSLYERLGLAEPGRAPAYLDIEYAAYARSANIKQKVNLAVKHAGQLREVGPSLILSAHDFTARPADLTRKVLGMNAEPAAAIVKIAYRARSLRDNLELFELLVQRQKPTIALGMGEFGLCSRILAPKFGGFLTFAALRPAETTAPGQPTVRELLDLYRFRSIRRATKVYGIIGWPVTQSKSPLVHNAAFDALEHDGVYIPLPIPVPESPAPGSDDAYLGFKATLLDLAHDPQLSFSGASVTIPHKEHLVRLAREQGWLISPEAAALGAANTLIVTRGARDEFISAAISNTDIEGLMAPLRDAVGDLSGRRVAILGAGGAARAAAYGALAAGAEVTIYNRDEARAAALAAELGRDSTGRMNAISLADLPRSSAEIFIHCTPQGMKGGPAPDACPIPVAEIARNFEAPRVVFDTVYNPIETPLLRHAKAAGWRTIDGVHMFVRQAMTQSKAWTGRLPPEGLFDRLVRESLA